MKRLRAPLPWAKYFGFLLKLCILAALLASIALALLPPRNVPPPVTGDESVAQRLSGLVRDASEADSARSFAIPSIDLQKWLASVVQLKSSGGLLTLDPRRFYATPSNGNLRLGLELALPAEYSVFLEGEYMPIRAGNGYSLQPLRYSIGRLPLPVLLGYPVERQFNGLSEALAVPLAQLARASFIEIAPDQISLGWPGAQRP